MKHTLLMIGVAMVFFSAKIQTQVEIPANQRIAKYPQCSSQNETSFVGTWKLVKSKKNNSDTIENATSTVFKIFTKKHVFFLSFDKDGFNGAGGGKYTVQGNRFTEKLSYLSWDHSITTKHQTYDYTITDNVLHQTGVLDLQQQSHQIDEYWQKAESKVATGLNKSLVGFWVSEEPKASTLMFLVFTDKYKHTIWVDNATGRFVNCDFGTYKVSGEDLKTSMISTSAKNDDANKTYKMNYALKCTEDGTYLDLNMGYGPEQRSCRFRKIDA